MRIAFAIVSLFESGGLQRDCMAIARLVRRRGHDVTIFAARIEGRAPDDLDVRPIACTAASNHGRNAEFSQRFGEAARGFDRRVGFDKLAGLDVLYCADPCVAARIKRRPWLAPLPRYRTLAALEGAALAPGQPTRILLLSGAQMRDYRDAWHTEPERLTLLPPSIAAERRRPQLRHDGTRERMRSALGLAPDDVVWLYIGAQPHIKGLDRVLRALARMPEQRLLAVGLREPGLATRTGLFARGLGGGSRVQWLGHREDIPELMAAADLLVHPARYDTTGTVILEAIANGLPVATTSVCGYASHVVEAGAGVVVDEPFRMRDWRAALAEAAAPERRRAWSAAALAYAADLNPFEGRARATDLMLS